MKYSYLVIVLVLILGCSSSDNSEIEEEMNIIVMDENNPIEQEEEETTTMIMGAFVSDAHPTTGKAIISEDMSSLIFENFMTDSGPLLLVYLSTDKNSTDFVNLGDLKGITGNFEYTIPEGTDLNKYNVVSIWCVDFLVSFGHAELK